MDIPYEPEPLIPSNSYEAENKSSGDNDEIVETVHSTNPVVVPSSSSDQQNVQHEKVNEDKASQESKMEGNETDSLVNNTIKDISSLSVDNSILQKEEVKSNVNDKIRTTNEKEINENKPKENNNHGNTLLSLSLEIAPNSSVSQTNSDDKSARSKKQRESKNSVNKTINNNNNNKQNKSELIDIDGELVKIALGSWTSSGGSPSGVVMIDKITRQIKLSRITPVEYPMWILNKAKLDCEIYYGQDFLAETLAGLLDSDLEISNKMKLSESLKNEIAQKRSEALIVDSGARKRASIESKTSLKARLGHIYSDARLLELLMNEKSNDDTDVLLWNTDITKMHEPRIQFKYIVPVLAQNPYLRVATPHEQEFVRKGMLKRQKVLAKKRETGTEYDSTPTKNNSKLDVSNISTNSKNEPKSKKEVKPETLNKTTNSKTAKKKTKSKKEEAAIDSSQVVFERSSIAEEKKEANDSNQNEIETENEKAKKKSKQSPAHESPMPKKRARTKAKSIASTLDAATESSFPWNKFSNDPVILENGVAVSPRQYQLYLVQLNAFDELARKAEGSGIQPPDFLKSIRSNGIPSYDMPSSPELAEINPTPLKLNESPAKSGKKQSTTPEPVQKVTGAKRGRPKKTITANNESGDKSSTNENIMDIVYTDSTVGIKKTQPSKKETKKKKKKKRSEWDDSDEGEDEDDGYGYGMPSTRSPSKFSKSSVYTNEELLTSSYSVLARNFVDHLEKEDRMSLYPLLSEVDRTAEGLYRLMRSNDQFCSGLKSFQNLLKYGHMDPEYMARSRGTRRRRDITKTLENEAFHSSLSLDGNSSAKLETQSQLQPEIPVTIVPSKDGEEATTTSINQMDIEKETSKNGSEIGNSSPSPSRSVTPNGSEIWKSSPTPQPITLIAQEMTKEELELLDKSVVEFRQKLTN